MSKWVDENGHTWLSGKEQIDDLMENGLGEFPETSFRPKEPGYVKNSAYVPNDDTRTEDVLEDSDVFDEWIDDDEDDVKTVDESMFENIETYKEPTSTDAFAPASPEYDDEFGSVGTYVSAADDVVRFNEDAAYIKLIENGMLVAGAAVLGIFGLGVLVGKSLGKQ